jgi:hypothetical protein
MNRYLALAGLVLAAGLTACEKNAVQNITEAPPASRIKFFNFGVGAPSVNFYANDMKMTAVTSATGVESVNGVGYGGTGSGGFYAGIAPGTYTLSGKISAATDKDLAITSAPATITDGKYYSYYVSGFYNTATKSAESFVVEDNFPTPDPTLAYVRFVNAISNSAPMVLNAKSTVTGVTTPLGAAVGYKAAGTYTAIPGGVYDLTVRAPGAAADAYGRTAVSFNPGRVYTVASRGDITITSTTAATRPQLDNTANY